MFKTKGGGVNGFLNNVQKTTDLVWDGTPYIFHIGHIPEFNDDTDLGR